MSIICRCRVFRCAEHECRDTSLTVTVYAQIAPRIVGTRGFLVLGVHRIAMVPRFVGHTRIVS